MAYIVLSDEQVKVISESSGTVAVRDHKGKHIGYVTTGYPDGITEEDVAIAKRRQASDQPRYTTQQVIEHLQSLENK